MRLIILFILICASLSAQIKGRTPAGSFSDSLTVKIDVKKLKAELLQTEAAQKQFQEQWLMLEGRRQKLNEILADTLKTK